MAVYTTVLLIAATHVRAQAAGDTIPQDSAVYQLEGVIVSTARQAATIGGASSVTVSIDSLHIPPSPSLEMVLREMPFVQVRQNSRGQAEISVRGSESRQVAVLMDGIPLTIGWDHRTDPSIVPIMGARSVTLVRGLSSVLYGPNVLGGIIQVDVSKGGQPRLDGRVRTSQCRSAGMSARSEVRSTLVTSSACTPTWKRRSNWGAA